ncbi:hypothetical protein OVN18_04325 [Microcella daejeonensis]|uniref:Uncharacterized protein n=1 Tax=Microcella daejeonensis TaxID=2994971 RepID=A0A9E8MMH8_9MICO|nr:hypothetical protein [Microcella daejeonensis]WAB82242.1 hypothetical protein OVN18_04325 [Microcella daejeonensis]
MHVDNGQLIISMRTRWIFFWLEALGLVLSFVFLRGPEMWVFAGLCALGALATGLDIRELKRITRRERGDQELSDEEQR